LLGIVPPLSDYININAKFKNAFNGVLVAANSNTPVAVNQNAVAVAAA
tara:strand:- start:1567 stop:1710 length:144 start_codon:yes stop_codon:yes gene_type:complete